MQSLVQVSLFPDPLLQFPVPTYHSSFESLPNLRKWRPVISLRLGMGSIAFLPPKSNVGKSWVVLPGVDVATAKRLLPSTARLNSGRMPKIVFFLRMHPQVAICLFGAVGGQAENARTSRFLPLRTISPSGALSRSLEGSALAAAGRPQTPRMAPLPTTCPLRLVAARKTHQFGKKPLNGTTAQAAVVFNSRLDHVKCQSVWTAKRKPSSQDRERADALRVAKSQQPKTRKQNPRTKIQEANSKNQEANSKFEKPTVVVGIWFIRSAIGKPDFSGPGPDLAARRAHQDFDCESRWPPRSQSS